MTSSPAGPLLGAAGVGLLAAALRLHDPHRTGSWGLCPLRALTGLDCPGCGGLRAVNDLTHGHLMAAASSNLLFVASIPLVVGLWAAWLVATARPGSSQVLPKAWVRPLLVAYAAVALLFSIVRNTPWGSAYWA